MARNLPKKQAARATKKQADPPADWAKKGLRAGKKAPRIGPAPQAAEKASDSRKPPFLSAFDNIPRAPNPYLVEAAKDVIQKSSDRFRTLFPNKANSVLLGMQPLEMILLAMYIDAHDGNYIAAAKWGIAAAPYRHPRLSHVHATVDPSPLDNMTEAALGELLSMIGERLNARGTVNGTASEVPGGGAGRTFEATEGEATILTVPR